VIGGGCIEAGLLFVAFLRKTNVADVILFDPPPHTHTHSGTSDFVSSHTKFIEN
jgi:hypothetical protein